MVFRFFRFSRWYGNYQFSIINYQCRRHRERLASGRATARAGIKEPRERSGNAEGIASGSSAVSGAGADFKEPRERSGNYQLSIINFQFSIINYQLSIINYQFFCPIIITNSPFGVCSLKWASASLSVPRTVCSCTLLISRQTATCLSGPITSANCSSVLTTR